MKQLRLRLTLIACNLIIVMHRSYPELMKSDYESLIIIILKGIIIQLFSLDTKKIFLQFTGPNKELHCIK